MGERGGVAEESRRATPAPVAAVRLFQLAPATMPGCAVEVTAWVKFTPIEPAREAVAKDAGGDHAARSGSGLAFTA